MSENPRTGRRRWPRIAVTVASTALAVAGVKAGSMYWFSATGASAYEDGDFAASERDFGRLETLNVIERARPYLGIGDARYRQDDLVGAEAAFARGLQLDAAHCPLRFNLAVTIEAQGDRLLAGEPLEPTAPRPGSDAVPPRFTPIERYSWALAVAAGDACPSTIADDAGARLAETRDRLAAKIAALDDATGDTRRDVPDSPLRNRRGDSEEIENLEMRNDAGANQREEGRDRDTSGVDPGERSNW